jgi:hypothetical protein
VGDNNAMIIIVSSMSGRDKTSTTTLETPDLYSTQKSNPSNLLAQASDPKGISSQMASLD